jgi:hypothetical protein
MRKQPGHRVRQSPVAHAAVSVMTGMIVLIYGCGTELDPITAPDITETHDLDRQDLAADIVMLPDISPREIGEVWEAGGPPADTVLDDAVDSWEPQPGEAGSACESGEDCNEGYCILTPDGSLCTETCQEECPFDWKCVEYPPALPDLIFICAPAYMDLCKPCHTNSDCATNDINMGQACIPYGPAGAFCGNPCQTSEDCPSNYQCEEADDISGGITKQCILTDGECQCSQLFVDQGAATGCFVENEWGTCLGERGCSALGLSSCSAATPVAESCNGLDDNCDSQVDEETSGDACLVVNQFGACPGTYECLNGKLACLGDEPKMELCDGEDNDCDGKVDEDFSDTDGDGIADCLENDKDGDGLADGLDNCPSHFNPDQKDFDLDLIGDVCDPDDDNDQTPDNLDCLPHDSDAHPGADEICDGKDNNCNGMVDEGFGDTDTDGWKDCVDDDDDNDGTLDGQDCNPLDPMVHPGAIELCDGKDNNCDFSADEGFPDQDDDGKADCIDADLDGDTVLDFEDNCPGLSNLDQADIDQDGVGDDCDSDVDGDAIPNGTDNCPVLKNTLQLDTDDDGLGDACDGDKDGDGIDNENDNCPLVANADQADLDQDGVGDDCEDDKDGDGVANGQDCAPLNPAVFPGAQEVCDGVDNDCDLAEDEGFPDSDWDGIKNCVDSDDDGDGDPDETDCEKLNPLIHAGALELCDNIDNDCDDKTDEDFGTTTCGKGLCTHVVPICENGIVLSCDPLEGTELETCDNLDNDCDGLVDEDLGTTTCGLGICYKTIPNCVAGQPQQCDPVAGAEADLCDGLDNDCDGKTDEELGTISCGQGACFHTIQACVGGEEMVCNPFAGAQPESCDGIDNDCDGDKDEDLGTVACGQGACLHEMDYCGAGKVAICNAFLGASPEVCDGFDNDCDSLVDEDLLPITCGQGICQNTVPACIEGIPQSCDPLLGALPEQCDGFDNDCDGIIDEGLGMSTCGVGQCLHTVDNCVDGQEQDCDPLEGAGDESCDAEDNDCDGTADPEDSIGCTPYFVDDDEDGYGVATDHKCLCQPEAPYTAIVDGDCADDNENVHPEASELCDTGLDDDCSGGINEGCVYTSCNALLQIIADSPSGTYDIDPDGEGGVEPFAVYCDMVTDSGGWTLVMKQSSGMGHGSPLSVSVWSGWSQPNVTMNPSDATLDDANMVNQGYSSLSVAQIRMTASESWTDTDNGAWTRTVNTTPYDALSNAKANQTGNEGNTDTTPWAEASFTDHTWTSTTTSNGLCWRAGPFFNRTSYEYTDGGIKWGWFFNNECGQSSTDTAEGLGCCGNPSWYRQSPWTLYLWAR